MKKQKNPLISFRSLFSALFFLRLLAGFAVSTPAKAAFTLGESAEVLSQGTYSIGAEPQIVLSNPQSTTGVNLGAIFDYPFQSDSSLRAKLGTGSTSYDVALGYKWVPFPDYMNQPAAGLKVEAEALSVNSVLVNTLRAIPLASKNFTTKYGPVDPYAGLAISLINSSASSATGIQLVGGSEIRPISTPRWTFAAELDLNLTNSWSSISGLATYNFDQNSMRTKIK